MVWPEEPASKTAHLSMKPRPSGSLKQALTQDFEEFGPGYGERLTVLLGVARSQVHRYVDPVESKAYPRLDQFLALLIAGRGHNTLEYLAGEAGCAVLPLQPRPGVDLAAEMSRSFAATGDLARAHVEALGDNHTPGRVDPDEAGRMIDAVDDAMATLAGLRAVLAARRDGRS
jgi:hypothetical protein